MTGTDNVLAHGRDAAAAGWCTCSGAPGAKARRGPRPRTPPDPRPVRWREPAVLATAGLAAAALNLCATHAHGWDSLTPGLHSPLENVVFSSLFAAVDATIAVYLAACLLALQRPNVLSGALSAALAVAPVALSVAKFSVLGSPAHFGDAFLLGDLARATDTLSVAAAVGVALATALAFALNARLARPRRALLDLSPLVVAGAILAAAAHSPGLSAGLAALVPAKVSDAPINGHVFNAYADLLTDLDRRHGMERTRGYPPPEAALGGVRVPPLERRNVHLVLVESLMDPAWLRGLAFSPPEPLAPIFARWRGEGRGSTAVVPIFGNRSANTEFEVLCGLPAAIGPADIAHRLIPEGSELPCLPRLLAAQGFRTMATAVTGPAFFNVGPALAAAGFGTRVFAADLDMTDRDGVWLSAEATLRQAENRAAALAAGGMPVLNHVFVASGHHPYFRDKARRPDRITITPHDQTVHDWVNGAHHNAAAVDAFVRRIAAEDPRALVVVLGDHQPPLGPNFRGYRTGGRLPAVDDIPPLQKATMFETPLLVLDAGEVVPVGRLPAFLLPELILDRLSDGEHCRRNACAHREPWRLRPFRDHAFEVEAHGPGEHLCPMAPAPGAVPPACADVAARSRAWLATMWRAFAPPTLAAPDGFAGNGR